MAGMHAVLFVAYIYIVMNICKKNKWLFRPVIVKKYWRQWHCPWNVQVRDFSMECYRVVQGLTMIKNVLQSLWKG